MKWRHHTGPLCLTGVCAPVRSRHTANVQSSHIPVLLHYHPSTIRLQWLPVFLPLSLDWPWILADELSRLVFEHQTILHLAHHFNYGIWDWGQVSQGQAVAMKYNRTPWRSCQMTYGLYKPQGCVNKRFIFKGSSLFIFKLCPKQTICLLINVLCEHMGVKKPICQVLGWWSMPKICWWVSTMPHSLISCRVRGLQ